MQYRSFGQLTYKPSALGFGAMRLPTEDNKPFSAKVIEDEAIRMMRHAIDEGVNYIDTAYFYHGGQSEVAVGKALKDGYRQKVQLATKSPVALIKEEGDFDKFLDLQLKRLDMDFIDMYLLHSLDAHKWENTVKKFGILEKAEKAKKEGKIGHIGFSFHDDQDAFMKIVDGYDKWEFCQIQLNYFDDEYQAGLKGLVHAAEKGLATVIMEPVRGGKLVQVNEDIAAQLEEACPGRTPAEWALDWVWNLPEVSLLLSGMSTMDQVVQNIAYADRAKPGMLSEGDLRTLQAVKAKIKEKTVIPCTQCSYCMPCPQGIDIPSSFNAYNESFMFADKQLLKNGMYLIKHFGGKTAEDCVGCGACESNCPQHIQISKHMETLKEVIAQQN